MNGQEKQKMKTNQFFRIALSATQFFSPRHLALFTIALLIAIAFLLGPLAALCALFILAIPFLPFAQQHRFADRPRYTSNYRPIKMSGEFSPEAFGNMVQQLRDQINAMLAGLPPLEQFEAASELSYGLRSIQNSAANMLELAENLTDNMTNFAAKLKADAAASAETALIGKGEYVKKTDATTAQDTAVNAAKEEVRNEVKTAAETKEKVTAARAKLVTDKVVSQPVADALSDDFFKADGYDGRLTKLTARLSKLKDEKLDKSDDFVSEMAALPLDDNGDKTFEARIKSVKSLVGASASRGKQTPATIGAVPPAATGAGSETPKRKLLF